MLRQRLLVPMVLVAATLASPARAGAPGDRTKEALAALTECAAAVVRDDRTAAEAALGRAAAGADAARAALDGEPDADRHARRRAEGVMRRTARLGELMADGSTPRHRLVRAAERGARAAGRLLRRLIRRGAECPAILVRPAAASSIRRGGGTLRLRAVPADGGDLPGAVVTVAETLPEDAAVLAGPLRRTGAGRYRVGLGREPGAVRIEATACGATTSLWVVVKGRRATLADPLDAPRVPGSPVYADAAPSFRVGEPAALAAPHVGGAPAEVFSVAPPLPEGLLLDPATGAIGGVPAVAQVATDHVVSARNAAGSAQATLRVEVTPALPDGVAELEAGFVAERWLPGLGVPVKLALAPDGRLFFTELATGNVRVVAADGALRTTPFHTLPVLTGGERGLLGIALSPGFAEDAHVFVFASVPAGDGHPDRNQIVRLTADGDVASNATVVVDDLPVGILHNGGDLAFGPDGRLYVSLGDTDDPSLAQENGARSGRILRYEPDGSVPEDNPFFGDPEWCRGLRNPFGLAFHPRTGGLFAAENGPTANDELLFVQPEKNFEWGPVPAELPEYLRGLTLTSWTPVIVPTGITFVPPGSLGPGFDDDLFLCGYDLADVRRVRLSGALLTDVDEELPFLLFAAGEEVANKPLDVIAAPGGTLYVSTFTAIWRVRRFSP